MPNSPRMKRAHRPDDADAHELVLGTLVDLQLAATAMAQQGAALAQLAGGLSPDGIMRAETVVLGSTGIGNITSKVPAHSIGIVNMGTCVMTVHNGGNMASPPGNGRGVLKIRPGAAMCVPLIGTEYSLYGRPNEQALVFLYKTLQPTSLSEAGGDYFPAQFGTLTFGGTAAFTYTTPWGDNAYYGGLAVADLAGPAGTSDVSELTVIDGNGVVLDLVNLAGKESTEDSHARATLATSPKIVVTCTKGSVNGAIRVW